MRIAFLSFPSLFIQTVSSLLPVFPGVSRRARGGVAMTVTCVECGRIVSKLNTERKCEECAKKDESMKSYFTKLFFINPGCARLVPVT